MRWLKNVVKASLRKRGLVIRPADTYQERLEPVRRRWLDALGVRTVIDVGAGDGGFARRSLCSFPEAHFYCFEPLDDQFAGLEARFGSNPRFTLVKTALSNAGGNARFFHNDYAGSSSLLTMAQEHVTAYPFTAQIKEETVDCTTLDSFFRNRPLETRVFLKLDVQGGELLVLQGAAETLRRTDAVYMEVSFRELYVGQPLVEEVIRFLSEAGFQLAGMENVSQSLVDGRFLQADAFFLKRPA
jgi:FkbM family methyltransferase